MKRADVVTALIVYVIPLGTVTVLLFLVGLGGLGLALLGIEAVVVGLTVIAKRQPPARSGPARRPWLVPLGMVAVLGGVIGISVVAAGR